MKTATLVPIIAAIVTSVLTLAITLAGLRSKASHDYVETLEKRLKACEDDCKLTHAALIESEKERNRITGINIDLMKRLFQEGNTHVPTS